jgi:hypothetical protein
MENGKWKIVTAEVKVIDQTGTKSKDRKAV